MLDAERQEEFRRCVGSFATGVTVVTAEVGEERAGMTLNAFASVSLDPDDPESTHFAGDGRREAAE